MKKPKYRRQKRSGKSDLAFVELDGHRFYLGDYAAKESRAEYRRLMAEWLATGGTPVKQDDITVFEVADRFLQHADVYYRREDGTHAPEWWSSQRDHAGDRQQNRETQTDSNLWHQ